jgi:hypothetical protein
MKFGKKFLDLENMKPQTIIGTNRRICTSKSKNVELKGQFFK